MTAQVNPRRRYHSPLRQRQAEQTRRRILLAARRLFVAQGFPATTVTAVAQAAAVSPDTIYASLGGKRGLLEGVLELAISGLDDPSSVQERHWREEMHQLADPRLRLRRWVAYSCQVLARTSPIHAVIRGAADSDAFAEDLRRRLLQQRLDGQTAAVRTYLAGALRPGLSVQDAGERFCALASPELYHLLIVDLAWPPERYQAWLGQLLETELLPSNDRSPSEFRTTQELP